ncbi:MAG: CocE/NonD family hydrolase [Bacteroidota bacterium]
MKTITISICLLLALYVSGQEQVNFNAADGLEITANLYEVDNTFPYILLFHQAGSSKGEYKESAIKLLKLDYNCLAIDLRSGDNCNYVQNETASRAKSQGLSTDYLDAEQDMLAAIDWAYEKSGKPVVLFGSSYSASLSLKVAKNNPKIKAVVAFSPGEYFKPKFTMSDELKGYLKPTFVASKKREFSYVQEMFADVPDDYKTLFQPLEGEGEHGAKALWKESNSSQEYWLALLLFFGSLK